MGARSLASPQEEAERGVTALAPTSPAVATRHSSKMPAAGAELPHGAQERGAEPPPHGERQYLGQIEHILRCGFRKEDRTGTGTLSVFGMQARYSLRGDRGRVPKGGWDGGGYGGLRAELRCGKHAGLQAMVTPNPPAFPLYRCGN